MNENLKTIEEKDEPKAGRSGLVGPILLIALGIFFLLSNLGVVTWSFWEAAARLWPIVLIALGLDLLVGRRSLVGSMLVLLVTVGMLAAGLFWIGPDMRGGERVTDNVSQPLNGAESAQVDINFGVGDLHLSDLPAGSSLLIEGTLRYDDRQPQRVEQSFAVRSGVAHYELAARGSATGLPFGGRGPMHSWDLALNRDVPMALSIRTGVGTSDLDLRSLNLSRLTIESGVGQTTVHMPAQGQVNSTINGGVGELIIEIPDGLPARIDVRTGLGNSQISGDFVRDGNVYTSPGYDTAVDRLDLDLRAGVGQVTVRRYGGR
jgi:hypothetical protein